MKCLGYKVEEDYVEIYIKHMFGKVKTYLYIKDFTLNLEERVYDVSKKKIVKFKYIGILNAYFDFKDKEERNNNKEKLKKIIDYYERKNK
jgi:hypothetical protein